jgi:CubicO group peptidase (beta-lactamase class C family)
MLEGHVHPDFWRVAKVLERIIPRSGGGGAALCVYHRGEKVVDLWGGTRDEYGNPWLADTLALSYSTTKGVASTLIHMLVDRGLIDYDNPVAQYWPEFAAQGKERITVRQLMCHEAGLYDIRMLVDDAHRMLDWNYMVDALANAAPVHTPGSAHGYHGLTYGWLVGELAQRVTGKPFGELLQTEIAMPLELDGLYVGLPEDQMDRRARLITPRGQNDPRRLQRTVRNAKRLNRAFAALRIPIDLAQGAAALFPPNMQGFDLNAEDTAAACIPALNGMFTARSLARIYATLAGGGSLDGVYLLSRETLDRATRVQNRSLGRVIPVPMHWRLGYHRVAAIGHGTPRAFGHSGYGGSGAWADPDRNLAVALTLNSGVGTPFGDLRIVRIGTAACKAAERR